MEREFEAMERECNSLSAVFWRLLTLGEYCSIKYKGRPKVYYRGLITDRRMYGRALPNGKVIPKF
jgi:hypothetical protein